MMRNESTTKEFILEIIAVIVCLALMGLICWQSSLIEMPNLGAPDGLYILESSGDHDEFIDLVHGIKMDVPSGMQVDMDYSSVRDVLTSDDLRIEIYQQDLQKNHYESYSAYSNQFAKNDDEIQVIFEEPVDWNDASANVLIWQRPQLSRLENDHCYYASVDFPVLEAAAKSEPEAQSGTENAAADAKTETAAADAKTETAAADAEVAEAYTVLLKSSKPIEGLEDIEGLMDSFEVLSEEEMTMLCDDGDAPSAFTRKTQSVNVKERGWNKETARFYNKYFGEKSDLTWGVFEPQTSKFDYSQLAYYEDYFDYDFPVIVNYTEVSAQRHKNLSERLNAAWENGETVLELTLQMVALDEGNMMYEILDGAYDEFLKDYAAVIADFGHPVLFRPMNEMNGDWCVYSAFHTSKDTEIYQAVYRYIYEIFREAGADANTIWVWNPNSNSYPGFAWNHTLMYYPGDAFVDVVGLTAYNTGAYYSTVGESWSEFSDMYENLYNTYIDWFGQPFMITEFASASFGGDKSAWIESMFAQLQGYEKVRMAIWWDGCDWDVYGNVARAYYLDENKECMEAFKKGLHGQIDSAVEVDENGRVSCTSSYKTSCTKKELKGLVEQLAKDKLEAFSHATTIEEWKGIGSINTRPDWLERKSDGTYGYSREKLQSLIKAGFTAGAVSEAEVSGHSVEATGAEEFDEPGETPDELDGEDAVTGGAIEGDHPDAGENPAGGQSGNSAGGQNGSSAGSQSSSDTAGDGSQDGNGTASGNGGNHADTGNSDSADGTPASNASGSGNESSN